MRVKIFEVFFLWLFAYPLNAQVPPSDRISDWAKAGVQSNISGYRQVPFVGDTSGLVDNSQWLQSIFDTLTQPSIILFGKGNYLFKSTIHMPAKTILKGLGNLQTNFLFNHDSIAEPSILFRGSETRIEYPLALPAQEGQEFIELSPADASNFESGHFFRMVQDDTDLVNDEWSQRKTGQVIRIDSVSGSRIYFSSPLRLNYPLERIPAIIKSIPIQFSGVECVRIHREDFTNTGSGSSNIEFNVASDCWISSVESVKCNFAHIEAFYSTNLLVEDNYFHDAHNFGSGGRAYGIMLHYATGEVLVQNNIFRRLRHAMILQAGANGNVFAYNYAYQGRKEILPDLFVTGEDLVCHGNYPYLNLFEGNYAQFASVDNSHGKNGPFNTYFRNMSTTFGFRVTSPVSPMQNFTGNHRINGTVSFLSEQHHITDNSWQNSSQLSANSLAYLHEPAFLKGYGLGKIGPPLFNASVSIPARDRALAENYISNKCDVIIWENGIWKNELTPTLFTKDYQLVVLPPIPVKLEGEIHLKGMELRDNATVEIKPGGKIMLHK
jgi:hypothetical protein